MPNVVYQYGMMVILQATMMTGQLLTWKGPYECGRKLARLYTMIFLPRQPVAIWLLSMEMAIDHTLSLSSIEVPMLARVDDSRNEMAWSATVEMNLPLPAREME